MKQLTHNEIISLPSGTSVIEIKNGYHNQFRVIGTVSFSLSVAHTYLASTNHFKNVSVVSADAVYVLSVDFDSKEVAKIMLSQIEKAYTDSVAEITEVYLTD